MNYETLRDALDGLMAYDLGATDSGIHDEALRERCRTFLLTLGEREYRRTLGRVARDLYLTDGQMAQGYGLEDVREFIGWLEDYLGLRVK